MCGVHVYVWCVFGVYGVCGSMCGMCVCYVHGVCVLLHVIKDI